VISATAREPHSYALIKAGDNTASAPWREQIRASCRRAARFRSNARAATPGDALLRRPGAPRQRTATLPPKPWINSFCKSRQGLESQCGLSNWPVFWVRLPLKFGRDAAAVGRSETPGADDLPGAALVLRKALLRAAEDRLRRRRRSGGLEVC